MTTPFTPIPPRTPQPTDIALYVLGAIALAVVLALVVYASYVILTA